MYIKRVCLKDFRNYELQELDLSAGTNILLGENAQGKTNALEAMYLLAVGKSHRTNHDLDLVRFNQPVAQVDANLVVHGREQAVSVRIGSTGKRATVNGVAQSKMTQFVGRFQVVLFAPEDLALVKGAPGLRRRFLDVELAQTQSAYLHHLSRYSKILAQRNSFLKRDLLDEALLDTLDEQLVQSGVEVIVRRLRFLHKLRGFAADTYKAVSDGRERLRIDYVSNVAEAQISENPDPMRLNESFYKTLVAKRASDRHHGFTSIGPHRDDLLFHLDDKPVHGFASQGQQRSIALALRLAEIDFIHDEVGEFPVLLLDDVLSELDDVRQTGLVLSMSDKVQTVITTTSLYHLERQLKADGNLFEVQSGIIQRRG